MTTPRVLLSSSAHSDAILMGFDGPTREDHTELRVDDDPTCPTFTIRSADGGEVSLHGPEARMIASEIQRHLSRLHYHTDH